MHVIEAKHENGVIKKLHPSDNAHDNVVNIKILISQIPVCLKELPKQDSDNPFEKACKKITIYLLLLSHGISQRAIINEQNNKRTYQINAK